MSETLHSHTFKPVPVPPNPIITTFFICAVVAAFVLFLVAYGIARRNVALPLSFRAVFFGLVLAGLVGFIVFFWLELTTLQACGLFGLLLPLGALTAFVAPSKA